MILNIGDWIIINWDARPPEICQVIGKNKSSELIIARNGGWPVGDSDVSEYNVSNKYVGKYVGYYIPETSSLIRKILTFIYIEGIK